MLHVDHKSKGQDQGQSQMNQIKSSEKQIIAILLLVVFSFFILITPFYAFIVYSMVVDYTKSPYDFAVFNLFYHVMHKMFYTNNAVNFFLYVISGNRFRTDLINLFQYKKEKSYSDSNTELHIKASGASTISWSSLTGISY